MLTSVLKQKKDKRKGRYRLRVRKYKIKWNNHFEIIIQRKNKKGVLAVQARSYRNYIVQHGKISFRN